MPACSGAPLVKKETTEFDDWPLELGPHLTGAEARRVRAFIRSYRSCFAFSLEDLEGYRGKPIHIQLEDDHPIFRRPYRLSASEKAGVQTRCQELLAAGLIELSNGEYACATVMPSKKDVFGNWTEKRMCGDYRPVNRKTKSDRYPMPMPEELFDAVGFSRVFSTLDLRSGYHQLPLLVDDRVKTAFWGLDQDGKDQLYHWKFLPFGLKNAPAEFQRVMDRVLAGLPFARCYIDDVIIFSSSPQDHVRHLQAVFERLWQWGLRLHHGKCKFFHDRLPYLGHMIVPGGLGVQQAKVDALQRIPAPIDVSRLRAFLGLANYYRRFVKNFSLIAKPLTILTGKDQPWTWGHEQQQAFDTLKQKLGSALVLRRPDATRPFQLHTDWSAVGLGAVLAQKDDVGREYVIAFASRSNNNAESNYSSYEGEALAAVWAIAHFRPYLYGQQFTLVTDHQPLKWLMESDKLTGKLARWALLLQEYDFEVVHRAGITNLDADGLSRNPSPSEEDLTGARWHGDCDREVVPGWHAAAYLTLMSGSASEVPDQGSDEELDRAQVVGDVWKDLAVLHKLQQGTFPLAISAMERDRVSHRVARFRWENGLLFRVWPDGARRIVPRPDQKASLVRQVHEELGHFGVRRTHSMLRSQYWWTGMYQQVATYVSRCEVCDRFRSSFNTLSPQLRPLPIMGLGYRWSLDFAGPLVVTPRGAKYVLVMVEHFSKWIELVALPQNSSELAAMAFLDRVLARFGAPAEVLTDQGREFLGSFEALCTKALIDHRTTSRDHPEADGLAERVVQTVKRGLRKYGLLHGNHRDWDLMLPWIAMGYRFSRQASLASYSPYQLLYGREPILPNSVREKLAPVVDLDDPDIWAQCLHDRAEFFKKAMPIAMENLSIAQHRDTLRYARIRSGAYRPQLRRFSKGDYVYLQREAPTTLDVKAGRTILRVKDVLPSGILLLEGKDGRECREHSKNCAPCHLPIDGSVHPELAVVPDGLPCFVCGEKKGAATMLLCDQCQRGWHMACLTPPLSTLPSGDWICPRCRRSSSHASSSARG